MNVKLYEFVKKQETRVIKNSEFNYEYTLLIDCDEIGEFCDAVGSWFFDDGGESCQLMDGYIAINIWSAISNDHLIDYLNLVEECNFHCITKKELLKKVQDEA